MPNVAVELDVGPVFHDFIVEGLEIGYSFVLVVQFASNPLDLSCILQVLPLIRLQFDNLSGPKVSENAVISNGLRDLVEATLEPKHSTNSNMVHGCATSVLVIDGGVLAQDMAVADSVHLVAGVAILVFVLMEPECKSALGILRLHPLGRKGNAEKSSEEPTDMVGGIGAADMVHKGWTCQPLQDGLTPFYDSIFEFMLPEKHKDLLGDLVGGIRGGRTRADANPYDDRTETPLLLSSPGIAWVKKWAGSTDNQLIFRVMIRSTILRPTVSQTPFSRVS